MNEANFDALQFLSTVSGGRSITNYGADEVIFAQGDAADAVFFIQTGTVKVFVTSSQGKEAVVGVLEAGQFFGEGCLIGQMVRLASAITITNTDLLRVEKAEMIRVLHAEPTFAEIFTTHLLTRNSRIEEDLVDQLFNSTEKRLARVLLLLANFGKEGEPELIKTKISQETFAEMVGTTRPRINFFMNKFRKLGFIEYNGDIKVNTSLLTVILRD